MTKIILLLTLAFALFIQGVTAIAKSNTNRSGKPKHRGEVLQSDRRARQKTSIVELAKSYKTNLANIYEFHAAEELKAAELEERQHQLYLLGQISKEKLQESMSARLNEKLKMTNIRKQIEEIDALIAEAEAFEYLSRSSGRYFSRNAVIRYNGISNWYIGEIIKVESFFLEKFNRSLPISAYGQTEVHNHLGFAHYNAIDIALHPDSPEGQALMTYLRSAGIPFLAFRQAYSSISTGAHIHIGKPSSRF